MRQLLALLPGHELRADERRVAEQVAQLLRRHQRGPVERQRVAMHDVRAAGQRDTGEIQTELLADLHVHLMVGQPQRHLGDLGRKLLDLDTVKLVYIELDQAVHVQRHLPAVARRTQDIEFQRTQLAVGDHQKIATAASRVEEMQASELLVELEQFVAIVPDMLELGPQLVEEQGPDQFEDVAFRRVVRTEVAARFRVHDRLEQGAEHGRRNAAPVQRAGLQQRLAQAGIKIGDADGFLKQLAVDVGKLRQLFVDIARAPLRRSVEHLEEARQHRTQIGAVLA